MMLKPTAIRGIAAWRLERFVMPVIPAERGDSLLRSHRSNQPH
jgi:hypothetical protein